MKMFFNIVTTFVLAYWPILLLTSVMIFDAPNSTDNRSAILMALTVVFLPSIIAFVYFALNQTFWHLKPKYFLTGAVVISVLAGLLFGYPKLLINNLKGISSNGYFIKDDKVFYDGDLIEAKPVSFETLDEFKIYARDADAVYFRGKRIDQADPKSFRLAFENSYYYRDDKNIFFDGQILEGSDASSFIQLLRPDGKPSSYFKDKNSVYWFGKKRSEVQAATVKVIGEAYIADAQNVFYFKDKIVGANPATFVEIPDQEGWGKDDKAVYYKEIAYPQIDMATLEILQRGYAKDKSKVYYIESNKLIEVVGANTATFQVTNWDQKTESEATDGIRYYLEGKAK